MASDSHTEAGRARDGLGLTDVVLPIALLAAFSVSIFDLAAHWLANPWTRYSLVFAPLVAWVARHEDDKRRHPRLGAVLIVAAVMAQLFSVLADTLALSRPALIVALIGLLINRGVASKRCALLCVFIVPIPYSLARETGGMAIAEAWMGYVAEQLGITHTLILHVLETSGSNAAALEVSATFGGAPLLALAMGLAGYHGLRLRRSLLQTAKQLLRWVALLVPLQFAALALAVVLLDTLGAATAEFLLDRVVWFAAACTIVYLTERTATRAFIEPTGAS